MEIKEYYKFYLSLHKNPKCRLLHYVGQWTTICFVVWCFLNSLYMLFLAPFVIYPFAWSGHLFFEKNKPLAWEGVNDYGWTTLKAKACDWIMFKDISLGRLSIW